MRLNRSHEFDTWRDVIDVRANMLRHVIFVARRHDATRDRVLIFMKFGVEKILGFFGCCKEGKPGFVFSVGNSLCWNAAVDEPISDLI